MESIDEQYPYSVRSCFHRAMKMCGSAGQAALCFRHIQPPWELLDQATSASAGASAMSVLCPPFIAPQLKFRLLTAKSFEWRLNKLKSLLSCRDARCQLSANAPDEQRGSVPRSSRRTGAASLRIVGTRAAPF